MPPAVSDLPWDLLVILGGGIVALVQWLLGKGERIRQESLKQQARRFGRELEVPPEPEPAAEEPPSTPVLRFERARPRPPARAAAPPAPPSPPTRPLRTPAARGPRRAARRRLRLTPRRLREAVLLREVLGPPRSLKFRRPRW